MVEWGNNNNIKNYNNIIYFNEAQINRDLLCRESSYFEKGTNGAFILCTDLQSLNFLREEILIKVKQNDMILFNLILGEIKSNLKQFLDDDKDFENLIQNICYYSKYNNNIKEDFPQLDNNIYKDEEDVMIFIQKYSSEEIKPFPSIKIKTYDDYINQYKGMHSKISHFYNDLTFDSYIRNFEKIKSFINEYKDEDNELNEEQKQNIFKSFSIFKITQNNKIDLIIEEYKKKIFFTFLNKNIKNFILNDEIAYFTSRFMYTLNSYAIAKKKYFNGKELYIGKKLFYSSLLRFEREKGKIIFFSDFKLANKRKNIAELKAQRFISHIYYEKKYYFSVIFIIQTNNNYISNAIEIEIGFNNEEIILLSFSFYCIKDVIFDYEKYTCDIYLENIGKIEILEEKIKMGKSIKYNEQKNIMEDE